MNAGSGNGNHGNTLIITAILDDAFSRQASSPGAGCIKLFNCDFVVKM